MLYVVAADTKEYRNEKISEIIAEHQSSEIILYDDTLGDVEALEAYLYPSLFNTSVSLIHAKYVVPTTLEEHAALIKKFVASPSVFVFEEFALPKSAATFFSKAGAIVAQGLAEKKTKEQSNFFAVTKALTEKDKKSRWFAYESALKDQPIEAILGILYWKVRDLIEKSSGVQQRTYRGLYRDLLSAHAMAWQTGAPLDLAIEKVILNI